MRATVLWSMGGMLVPLTTLALVMHVLPEGFRKHPEASERSSHDGRKRGPSVQVGDLMATTFDYWRPEKSERPILARYRLRKCQGYPEDGEIIIEELPASVTVPMVFAGLRKQMRPPDDDKEVTIREIEFRKEAPTITELVVRKGTFVGDDGKKEMRNARLIGAVVESREKKFLVRLVGPKDLVRIVQPDLEIFLSRLKH